MGFTTKCHATKSHRQVDVHRQRAMTIKGCGGERGREGGERGGERANTSKGLNHTTQEWQLT